MGYSTENFWPLFVFSTRLVIFESSQTPAFRSWRLVDSVSSPQRPQPSLGPAAAQVIAPALGAGQYSTRDCSAVRWERSSWNGPRRQHLRYKFRQWSRDLPCNLGEEQDQKPVFGRQTKQIDVGFGLARQSSWMLCGAWSSFPVAAATESVDRANGWTFCQSISGRHRLSSDFRHNWRATCRNGSGTINNQFHPRWDHWHGG